MSQSSKMLGKTDYFDLEDNALFVVKGIKYKKRPGGPETGATRLSDGKKFYFGDSTKVLTLITVTKAEYKKAIVDWQRVISELAEELAGARNLRNQCFQRYNQLKYGFKFGDKVSIEGALGTYKGTFESYATPNEHYSPYKKKNQAEVFAKVAQKNGNVFHVDPTGLKRVKI